MHTNLITFVALTLPILAPANPTPRKASSPSTSLTTDQILHVAPKSADCTNPPEKGECATAEQAARNIAISFDTYDVSSRAEQAAVIGLMAFESEEFKYSRNHFPAPGVEGKGTRNMQSPDYNVKYAHSLPAIKDKVQQTHDDKGQILDLLLADKEYDFGSGAWFLTSQCKGDVRKGLQSGSEEGWKQYITECVGTEASEERKGYWQKAVEALSG